MKPLPSTERINEILLYEPHTGNFYWKINSGKARIGHLAGHMRKDGYRVIDIDRIKYRAHRLAFKVMHGRDPVEIDHEHGKISDASWNLREATRQQNNQNVPRRKDNTSGYKGVHWVARVSKWAAMINVDGKQRELGTFADKEAAYAAYCAAANELHGAFARVA